MISWIRLAYSSMAEHSQHDREVSLLALSATSPLASRKE